ncbi:MAG: SDR family NAD(P)-dependent oxidoreductase [Sphingopyxis sp.]|nr:SDR family NAD(P)-dependent oxidoreductase [Sphingopyxis sp.]
MNVNGCLALVTGGTDGIGRELAQQLRNAGATVVVSGRALDRLAAMREAGFEAIEADLSTPAGVDTLVSAMADRPLALLINNAGSGSIYDPDRLCSLDDASATIRLNLDTPIQLTTRLLPQLRAQREAAIVNVTSGLAIAPRAGGSVYCATKAGLRSYTQALRHLLKDSNVRVIEALPPVVDTKMTAGRGNRKMSPQACAAEILRGIQSGRAEINVGMVKVLQLVHNMAQRWHADHDPFLKKAPGEPGLCMNPQL